MSLLDDIFSIAISSATAAPSRPGFGTPLLLSYHTAWTNRVRVYSSAAAMLSDGFTTAHPAYKWASTFFAQNPSPKKIKIGRRLTAPSQSSFINVRPSPPVGAVLSFSLDGTVFSHTVGAGPETAASCATALAAAVTAALPANVASATVSGTTGVSMPSVATKLVNLINLSPLYLENRGDSSGTDVTADLSACAAEDNDWYALAIDSCSTGEATTAAAYAETSKKLFIARNSDSDCSDATVHTDIGYVAKTAAYGRTGVFFNRAGGSLSNIDAGILGSRLTADPGSDTWAFKTLATIPADTLTDAERAALAGKRVSYYVNSNDVNFTQGGQVASGEWIDVVRGLDWVRSELQIAQFTLALNRAKIPFTDVGITMVKGVIQKVLKAAEKAGLFADNSSSVSAPAAADVDPADKAARILRGVTWTAELSGAIHSTDVNGTVTV